MNTTHDVISDFLDEEAFDPAALGEALADPAGRDLLIDFVVLRYATQAEEPLVEARRPRVRSRTFVAVAAAVLLALVGGYQLGHRENVGTSPSASAPEPTRVLEASSWQAITQENNQ
jgi:hypothetical protein